ncbi:Rv3654c family TadE-like protein [Bifidobacterium sp. ESL0790]|uniref:Rv3654c family TadE-like protein n=1 Tax=Bifidobacterium sp. ESL0790 TaxID=2983233 RepID=UPI0023F95017|nr:Rv3654c family TadE-like protein [Bifidobacterium sp. ESL0790]WEV72696.1 flp pilus-assembly TadE/G-like family protein [Bifidobacterium sp. ESL0790]
MDADSPNTDSSGVVSAAVKPPRRKKLARMLRRRAFWRGDDEGSGTVTGVMLVAVTAILLVVIAMGGRLLICIAHARSVADQAAIAGAISEWKGEGDPCIRAGLAASANGGVLISCTVKDDDVNVKVSYATSVPVAPQVVREARAGPVPCGT